MKWVGYYSVSNTILKKKHNSLKPLESCRKSSENIWKPIDPYSIIKLNLGKRHGQYLWLTKPIVNFPFVHCQVI